MRFLVCCRCAVWLADAAVASCHCEALQPRELSVDNPQLVFRVGFVEPVDHPDQRADVLLGLLKELKSVAPGGGTVAPKPKLKPARFVFVFGMAVTILAILTWVSRDLAAPTPPTESIYQPQRLILY